MLAPVRYEAGVKCLNGINEALDLLYMKFLQSTIISGNPRAHFVCFLWSLIHVMCHSLPSSLIPYSLIQPTNFSITSPRHRASHGGQFSVVLKLVLALTFPLALLILDTLPLSPLFFNHLAQIVIIRPSCAYTLFLVTGLIFAP